VLSKVAHLPTHSLRYLEAGAGPATVLLHAFPLGAEQWLPQLLKPSPGQRLVAPDLRGFGGRDPGAVPGGISIDTYADDVSSLMAHLEIPRARIVGSSMGGYVALAMLARHAARIRSLVLADTRATADSSEAKTARERMLGLIDSQGLPAMARELIPKLLGPTTRTRQPDLADAIERIILGNHAEGASTAIRAMRDRPDRTDLLGSVGCPTTVVCGAEDGITPPAECEALSRAIPGARFVLIAEAGHLPNVENPAAFAAALNED
jgi:pimeloyl-ACP methyl ester carboxylesterase